MLLDEPEVDLEQLKNSSVVAKRLKKIFEAYYTSSQTSLSIGEGVESGETNKRGVMELGGLGLGGVCAVKRLLRCAEVYKEGGEPTGPFEPSPC